MRRSLNVIFAIILVFSLILTAQHSILAQAKSDQESPRAMLQRLQQEIGKLQANIAKNPSSSKVGEMKSKIQWNRRKIKEIAPNIKEQTERKIKATDKIKNGKTQTYSMERYSAIIKNNLFTPLGSGGEVKRKGFVLTGILGKSAFIQIEGSSDSFYVAEGRTFGNGAKLTRIGENSVTIVHEGNKKELKLASGAFMSQSRDARGGKDGGTEQRQKSSGKNSKDMKKEMKATHRAEKERGGGGEKKGGNTNWASKMSRDELNNVRGDIGRYIEGLEKKGVRDPEAYKGAFMKMEAVERAMAEKESSSR